MLVRPTALSGPGAQPGGQAARIGATLCYAASTVYIRRFVSRPPLEMATGSMIAGTGFAGGLALVSGADIWSVPAAVPAIGAILCPGLFCTACANLIYFYLVPRPGATRMSQVNFAVPVGGAMLGFILLGEALTPQADRSAGPDHRVGLSGHDKSHPDKKHPPHPRTP